MDPIAALQFCHQAISDCDIEDAREHLANYRRWRASGGLQPEVYGTPGDAFARECARRIKSQEAQSCRA